MPATTKSAVTVQYRRMIIPPETASLGVENDRNAECVAFVLPRIYEGIDLATKTFFVDTMSDNGGLFDASAPTMTSTDEEIHLLWTVGPLPASTSGTVRLRLRALGEDFLWQTETGAFQLAATFATDDPPDPPGQSYFDNALLQVIALRDQAAASAGEAAASVLDAHGWAVQAATSAGGMASRWNFYTDGASVSFYPAAGSAIQATPSATTTLTFNGASQAVTAKTTVNLVALAGKNTLSVAAGTALVAYNRESGEVIRALTAQASASGPIAALYPAEGLPLDATAHTVAAQSGSGSPSPDNPRPIVGKGTINFARTAKNLLKPSAFSQSGVTATVNADGSVTVSGTNNGAGVLNTPGVDYLLPGGVAMTLSIDAALAVPVGIALAAGQEDAISGGMQIAIGSKTVTKTATRPCWGRVSFAVNPGQSVSFTAKLQLEQGSVATAFEAFSGNGYAMSSPQTLYGLSGAQDELSASGAGLLRTHCETLDGSVDESIAWNSTVLPNTAGYNYTIASSAFFLRAGDLTDQMVASYLDKAATTGGDTEGVRGGGGANRNVIVLRINKSRIAGWSDSLSNAEKVTLFRAYLAAHPLQILWELGTPIAISAAKLILPAQSGLNQVFTDGGGDTSASGRLSMQRFADVAKAAGWAL